MSIIERNELRELLAEQRAIRGQFRYSPYQEKKILKEIRRIKMAIQEDRARFEWSGFLNGVTL